MLPLTAVNLPHSPQPQGLTPVRAASAALTLALIKTLRAQVPAAKGEVAASAFSLAGLSGSVSKQHAPANRMGVERHLSTVRLHDRTLYCPEHTTPAYMVL